MGGDVSTNAPVGSLERHAPSCPLGADGAAPSIREMADRAIAWMNHGHALASRDAGMEALVAYAHAIVLLRPLPFAENPAWANSLGAALMNHGQLLHRVHGIARATGALASFAEAIVILTPIPAEVVPWARRNLAGTHLNRANLQLDLAAASRAVLQPALRTSSAHAEAPRHLDQARTDAESALALVAATERDRPVDAELALKARRARCDVLGQQLVDASATVQDELANLAGDTVDDALALIHHWAARDASAAEAFAPLAERFFRFGCELYRRHQPHFLVEFIEENLVAVPTHADELRAIAHLALDAALADGALPALHLVDDPVSERALRTRADLHTARERLAAPPLSA